MTSLWAESYLLITPKSPRKLVTLNPKLKSTGADATSFFPVGGMPTRKQLGLKDFSPKVRTLWHYGRRRGALPMIDRGDIRQAIDRCSNIWASLPGAEFEPVRTVGRSLIAKFKEAGGTVREIDVWAESPHDYLRSGYLHHRLPVTWAVNHYRTLSTKPARQKCQRTGSWRTRQLLTMQMRQRDVLRSMQNTRRS